MNVPWYDVVWPWIGCGGALALLVLLFCTDYLQGDKVAPKWKDAAWIAWLCTAAYLIHNVEEYGIDIYGNLYAFPECFKAIMVGSGKEMPDAFFMAINIPAFWITFPLVAAYSRTHKWASPVLAAVLFVNAVSHMIPFAVGVGYTPGALTAALLFFPISIWVGITFFGKGRLPYKWMLCCLVAFLISTAILLGSAKLYIFGIISTSVLVFVQIINGPICFVLAWFMSRIDGGKLVQPQES